MAKFDIAKKLDNKFNYKAIIEEGKEFKDVDFPAGKDALGPAYDFPFKSAKDIFRGRECVYDKFEADDILQGCNKDGYFLSAVSALSEFPARLEKLFLVKKVNNAGIYAVTLYIAGCPTTIVVDSYFPYDEKTRKPAFAGTNQNELWVMILEKAWAKFHGSYTNIDEGDPREALAALTGSAVDKLVHESYSEPKELWKLLSTFDRERYVMCTGGAHDTTQGLIPTQTYTLINVYEVRFKEQEIRLVQLRNPTGKGEWKGAWSDEDKEHWSPELNKELNHTSADDGTFFMQYEDFVKAFSFTCVARAKDDFVHAHSIIEEIDGFAVAKAHKQIKGVAVAHQMTPRCLNKFIGKPPYKVEPLSFDIFSFTGTSILPLKLSSVSNELGYAQIPIYLEPGYYILQAKFKEAPNLIPFINFVTYSDNAIDIVGLKAKKLVDITMEVCEKALKNVISLYEFKKPTGKLSCNFKKCPKAHSLVWSADSKKDEYTCEACKTLTKIKDGRWYCAQCEYEICPKCKPKEIVKVVMDEKKNKMTVKCNAGHLMNFVPNKEKNFITLCDMCGEANFGNVATWFCEKCNVNVCRKCLKAPPGYPQENVHEIDICPRNHKLNYAMGIVAGGLYNCCFCGKLGDPVNGRWYCEDCNLNICGMCIPYGAQADVSMTAGGATTICNKGHTLTFTSDYSFDIKEIKCAKCNKPVPLGNFRWNCHVCNYDICSTCRVAPEKKHDLLCNKKHSLAFSRYPIGKVSFTRCDRCHEAFTVTEGRYCCGICCYNLCQKCEPNKDDPNPRQKGARECHPFEGCCII